METVTAPQTVARAQQDIEGIFYDQMRRPLLGWSRELVEKAQSALWKLGEVYEGLEFESAAKKPNGANGKDRSPSAEPASEPNVTAENLGAAQKSLEEMGAVLNLSQDTAYTALTDLKKKLEIFGNDAELARNFNSVRVALLSLKSDLDNIRSLAANVSYRLEDPSDMEIPF